MENTKKIEVNVEGVEIGDKVYCPFCAEETRRSSYGTHQYIDGYYYYCTCENALKNDQIRDEIISADRASDELKRKQAEIPIAKNKLNRLKFEEGIKQLCDELAQPNPLTSTKETGESKQPE